MTHMRMARPIRVATSGTASSCCKINGQGVTRPVAASLCAATHYRAPGSQPVPLCLNASESTSSAMRHRCRHGNLHGRLSVQRLMCGCRGQYTLRKCDIPAMAVICRTAAASLRLPHCRLQLQRPHAARQLPLLQRLHAAHQLLLPLRSRT